MPETTEYIGPYKASIGSFVDDISVPGDCIIGGTAYIGCLNANNVIGTWADGTSTYVTSLGLIKGGGAITGLGTITGGAFGAIDSVAAITTTGTISGGAFGAIDTAGNIKSAGTIYGTQSYLVALVNAKVVGTLQGTQAYVTSLANLKAVGTVTGGAYAAIDSSSSIQAIGPLTLSPGALLATLLLCGTSPIIARSGGTGAGTVHTTF
jgi:hypothetical protein